MVRVIESLGMDMASHIGPIRGYLITILTATVILASDAIVQ